MDGLSLAELAEDDDATTSAVSSKLARARRAFREAYEKSTTTTRSVSEGVISTRGTSDF
jgi:DNA-directed RNA polymerase specialized sigma24 family protein